MSNYVIYNITGTLLVSGSMDQVFFTIWDNFTFWTGVLIQCVGILDQELLGVHGFGFLDLDTFLTHCPFTGCFT